MVESLHVDNVEFWHDVVCAHILEGACSDIGTDFKVDLSVNRSSGIQFSRIRGTGHRYERKSRHISKSSQDFFVLALQVSGTAYHVADGREVLIHPGEVTCNDSTRPLQLTMSDGFEQLLLHLPRSVVLGTLGPTERFTTLELSKATPVGSVVVPFLRNVSAILDQVARPSAEQLSQTAMSLIMTALSEYSSTKLDHPTWSRDALLYRAEDFIRQHAREPELTPTVVASALRISVRSLQLVFQDIQQTPSEYIWQCRLQNCAQDLANPAFVRASISDIAFRGGFSDQAHFSRRFKRAYGMSASEFREQEQMRWNARLRN